jgi:ubiquinone biosynthesis protein UbiJ
MSELLEKLKPTWRDLFSVGVGYFGGKKLVGYLEDFQKRQNEAQTESYRRVIREEMQTLPGMAASQQSVLSELVSELKQTREAYKSLSDSIDRLNEKLGDKSD